MSSYSCEDQLYKTLGGLKDAVGESLEDRMSYGDASHLGLSYFADEALVSYLKAILEDPKTKAKLVRQVRSKILHAEKVEDQIRKAHRAKNLKVWNITKGKIPCIRQCGYYQQQTKEETLKGSNMFACKECSAKAEKEDSVSKLFSRNIFSILGIE